MKVAVYGRVSTNDKGQDVEVQVEPLLEWLERFGYGRGDIDVYREEGISGAKTSRPQLDALMKEVRRRRYMAVAVWKLDRLGRSLQHLLQLLQDFETNGTRLLVYDMAVDTATPQGKLFFSMVGAFAEFERAMISERVRAGMLRARRLGRKIGRPSVYARRGFRPRLQIVLERLADGSLSRRKAAKELGIGYATLKRILDAQGNAAPEVVSTAEGGAVGDVHGHPQHDGDQDAGDDPRDQHHGEGAT